MFALRFADYGTPDVLTVDTDVPEPHPGPGQIRIAVRTAGLTPGDRYLRSGTLRHMITLDLPHTTGVDGAGTVDEIGPGVTGVAVGDAVFGLVRLSELGGTTAEFAVLEHWAPKPDAWDWAQAGGAAGNVETATRVLDLLGVTPGSTLLIEGAAGGVGTVATQLARARGATVIGTGGPHNHRFLTDLGAVPTTHGPGLPDRVAALAPGGVDFVLDAAGSGSLPDLVTIAGTPDRVITVADFTAAEHGVHLSTSGGPNPDPVHAHGLAAAAALAGEGRLRIPVHAVFPLAEAAKAHEVSESRRVRGKIVLSIP